MNNVRTIAVPDSLYDELSTFSKETGISLKRLAKDAIENFVNDVMPARRLALSRTGPQK